MIKHLACITSGNRTWAKKEGMIPWLGYKYGVEAFRRVIDFCLEKQIPYLSLYLFSIENFKRPENEKNYLFKELVQQQFNSLIDEAFKKGVKVQFLGERSLFPDSVKSLFEKAEEKTAHLKNLTVNFLFCYGGRQEIVHGVKEVLKKIRSGELNEDELTPELFAQNLWTGDMPDPDLIIRADGEVRLSNFLLYQASYAELYFTDCMWPAINNEHLNKALDHYNKVKRNFGA
jgi:undecaprenyl diphosphate synthase